MKLCPQHQKLNNLDQEVVTMILYLQSNKMCVIWTSTIPCVTLRPKYHYAALSTHVIVAGDVTLKLNLKHTLTGDIHECVVCQYNSDNHRHVWKHYRTQHFYIHTHICKVKGYKDGKNNKPYGNDEQHTVWAHMATAHKVPNPMSCPKCKKSEAFSSKKRQRDHIQNCEELEGKSTKKFGCDFVGCGKRYKTQQALNTH